MHHNNVRYRDEQYWPQLMVDTNMNSLILQILWNVRYVPYPATYLSIDNINYAVSQSILSII